MTGPEIICRPIFREICFNDCENLLILGLVCASGQPMVATSAVNEESESPWDQIN